MVSTGRHLSVRKRAGRILEHLRLTPKRVNASIRSRRYSHLFDNVERYCMFIGYPRSGHTLIGSILDAHPDMIVSNELHALRYVQYGFTREQLFTLIMENSRRNAERGRVQAGYVYNVPNQYQGRSDTLKVIGDKRGGDTSSLLGDVPALLDDLRDLVKVPLRFIHVVRNPFDNITTIKVRSERDLQAAIDFYFRRAEINERLRRDLGDALFETRLEAFIGDPRESIADLCRFLEVPCPVDYIEDSASIVFDRPRRTRDRIEWPREMKEQVMERMEQFSFLKGYTFDD
ncbi:MAG TPA: sulfotransferase [Thermoplasmata archaeon]|nr:sulfotransferase [Thermoplasmata archaeon]